MSFASRALAFLVVAGCAGTPSRPATATSEDHGADFDRIEDGVLRELAAVDGRLARRARLVPSEEDRGRASMEAVLHGDEAVAVVDGVIDPFSFDARARGISAARAKASALFGDRTHAVERDLLLRVLDAETARLDEERRLPRSAGALIRALVDGWRAPRDDRAAAAHDRWLARRLDLVRASMTATPLDVIRARDVDDALDGLERLARGLTESMREILRIREAVEDASTSRPAPASWDAIAARARAYLGTSATAETLSSELAATERTLRERAIAMVGERWSGTDEDVFVDGPCVDAVPGSRVRSMAAPPEREPACHLRHLAASGANEARVLAVLHDHVIVGQWALDTARGLSTLTHAEGEHHLLVPVPPHVRSRYERIALARPVVALGAALTARLLSGASPLARAEAWATLGDVPLDVAEAELTARR